MFSLFKKLIALTNPWYSFNHMITNSWITQIKKIRKKNLIINLPNSWHFITDHKKTWPSWNTFSTPPTTYLLESLLVHSYSPNNHSQYFLSTLSKHHQFRFASFVCNFQSNFTRFPVAGFAFSCGLSSFHFSKLSSSTLTGIC